MNRTILVVSVASYAWFCSLAARGDDYVWDNQNTNGIWNDPVNWGIVGDKGYDVAPTALDGVLFRRNFSPAGTVKLNADGFAQRIRQEFSTISCCSWMTGSGIFLLRCMQTRSVIPAAPASRSGAGAA